MSKKSNTNFAKKLQEEYDDTICNTVDELNKIWDRIGFNCETKRGRLELFYNKLIESSQGILESEEDLEETIEQNISEHHQAIRTLSYELCVKYDDKYAAGNTMLDEERLLREKLKQLQNEKKRRLEEFHILSDEENVLCTLLKEKQLVIPSVVPTESEIESLKQHIKELGKLKCERKQQILKYSDEIQKLFYDIDLSKSDDSFTEAIIYDCESLPLSENDVQRAKNLRDELRVRDEKLNEKIKTTRIKIRQLWGKLNIENQDVVEVVDGCSNFYNGEELRKARTIEILNEELDRCVQIKMQNMQRFIEQTRIEIESYYTRLYYSQKQINEFNDYMKDTDYTEELLKIHEEKLEDLRFHYTEAQGLYEKITKWLQLWEQFVQFEDKSKDPNRFKVRGYNAVEEEKTRKHYHNQLPKLEDDIRNYADEYSETNGGQEFQIYGFYWRDYIQTLRNDYETFKKNEKKEKQILRDKNSTSKVSTPSMLRTNRTIKRKQVEPAPSQTPMAMRSSKLQRMDDNTLTNTPKQTTVLTANKLKNARKSRTPLKGRLRRSGKPVGGIARTVVTSTKNLKTLGKPIGSKTAGNTTSSSSKYVVPSGLSGLQTTMYSNTNDSTLTTTGMSSTKSSIMTTTAPSHHTTTTTTSNTTSNSTKGFPFKNINPNDVNYLEFTRDLKQSSTNKPFRFNGQNGSTQPSNNKYDNLRSKKENDVKTALTSTILHE